MTKSGSDTNVKESEVKRKEWRCNCRLHSGKRNAVFDKKTEKVRFASIVRKDSDCRGQGERNYFASSSQESLGSIVLQVDFMFTLSSSRLLDVFIACRSS